MLDLMYMPDAIRAMVEVMEADPSRLSHRNAYNITAMSVTPTAVAAAIRRRLPDFVVDYEVDPIRQAIADFVAQLARRQRGPQRLGMGSGLRPRRHDG